MTASASPRVSVVLAAFRSHNTVAATLAGLQAQTYRDAEVIVVDSSPDTRTADLVRGFPGVVLVRSSARLMPHEARNLGVRHARGSLLAFSDADIIPAPTWLERLVAAYDRSHGIVVGSFRCHGERWLDNGVHICKFSRFLPAGPARPIDVGPTGNLLVPREIFDALGAFPPGWLGDVSFSRAARARGVSLRFQPDADVAHWHEHSLLSFLKERFSRGVLFGEMRNQWMRRRRGKALGFLVASVLPVRLARILFLTAGQCRKAGSGGWLLAALPVVVLGHQATLLGESLAYARGVMHFSPNPHETIKTATR